MFVSADGQIPEGAMSVTNREMQKMSPGDQLEFNKWIRANAVVGAIFAVGMLAMAFAGGNSPSHHDAAFMGPTTVAASK
jgi:hypothetical protein